LRLNIKKQGLGRCGWDKLGMAPNPKMPTAGAGGRVVVPTEFLFPLGNPQRFSLAKAIPVSFT
jgi:hypothetical protein